MRIVHISAEFAPIAKAGGLGEVLVGLSRELTLQNQDVEVIIPKYDFIPTGSLPALKMEIPEFKCSEHGIARSNTMWSAEVENCQIHLLESYHSDGYFQRPHIYGYPDDTARFIYFSRAALEYLKLKNEPIDVLHLHEWHTALCAPLIKDRIVRDLKVGSIVLTIHNLEYQGKCAVWDLDAIGMNGSDYLKPDRLQDDAVPETINLLKGGINYADAVNTVSPTYAKEILTPSLGYGLDLTLCKHKDKLCGILNGIDQKLWNPSTDKLLAANFASHDSVTQIETAKRANKIALEKRFGLEKNKHPWIGAVTRLVSQKGPELLEEAMNYTLSQGGVFVLLGTSSTPAVQNRFEELKLIHKDNPRLLLQLDYDEPLAHLIYAALDFTFVPSHFEPCGLTQLIAMRYGTIPIVRSTGGLKDTVFDCDDSTVPILQRNGFTFSKPSEISATLKRAFHIRNGDPAAFQSLIRRAIQSDYSWKKPAEQYLKLYRKITPPEQNQPDLTTPKRSAIEEAVRKLPL